MRRPIIIGVLAVLIGVVLVSRLAAGPSGPTDCAAGMVVSSFSFVELPDDQLREAAKSELFFDTPEAAASFFIRSYEDAGRQDGEPVGELRSTKDANTFEIVTGNRIVGTVSVVKIQRYYHIEAFSFCMDAVPAGPLPGVEVAR